VTPSAADYYTMRPEDICVLRLDTLQVIEGDLKPSVESGLHAAMLRFHRGADASVHTHQPLASAVALIRRGIPLDAGDPMGGEAALVGYGPSGTSLLVRALSRRLRPGRLAYLLRNHGVICAAGSLDEAIASVARLEAAAARLLDGLIARRPPSHPALADLIGAALQTGRQP
jgi:L-fuculose-phosphate aldolase